MPKKSLKKIKEKLLSKPLSELNGKELAEYYDYRLGNLVMSKKILVARELQYLLCDVGKGSLRFDPELLSHLNIKEVIAEEHLKNALKETEGKKIDIQKNINSFLDSTENTDLFIKLIKHYCGEISVLQNSPLIISAKYETVPILFLIKNGQWVMPEKELFDFIRLAKTKNCQPIVIAKKIHGILFPFFKGLLVLGFNLYSVMVSKNIMKQVGDFKSEAILSDHYNEKIDDLEEIAKNITSDYYDENLLKKFFEELIPKYLGEYYKNFCKQKIEITDFENTVKQIKGAKARKGILKWIEKRKQLIIELKG